MKKLLVATVMCVASLVHAGEWDVKAIGIHLGSVHSTKADSDGTPWNNANPGFYVRAQNDWLIGGYYNSIRRPTVYVAKVFPIVQMGSINLDLTVGGATGYRYAVTPLVSPSVTIEGIPLRLHYLPGIGGPHVLHLSYEYKF